jgi:integrase
MTLQQFFDSYYRPLKLRGKSPATFRLYGCTIRTLGKFLERPAALEDIADEMTLARFLEHRAGKVSPYSAEKERSQLMAMARLANDRRMIAALPTCEPGPLPDRIPVAWSEEQLRKLFVAAESLAGYVGRVPERFYFPALIQVCFETSERIGALLSVEPQHFQRPFLTVPGEIRKGGRRARVYELSAEACDRIEQLMIANHDRIFLWTKAPTYLWDRVRKILTAAGLSGKRLAFQQVRRSAISHMARATNDATAVAFAGHSQSATTRRWYLDPRYVNRGPKPADMLPRLDGG